MGGLAFASGLNPVFTPRMPPNVYRAVRDRCQEKLRELFVAVATPIEAPAKTSFGDIDLLVAWNRQEVFPPRKPATFNHHSPESPKEAISRVLGAIRCKSDNPHTMTMAIPWPEDFPFHDTEPKLTVIPELRNTEFEAKQNIDADEKATNDPKPTGIQVDIHVCETLDHLQWMLFKQAHGDLWNLLGSTIRPFGLTVDEVGLYVRIPEIEEINKAEAKVLLSTDPGEILCFLGMKFDDKQWEEPFASDEVIYEYATTCRLFWVKPKETEDSADGGASNLEVGDGEESGAVMVEKRKLKANDRRRMAFRPLFRNWISVFLPACQASGRFPSDPFTREEVLQQAFEYFPGVQPIYDSRITEWRIKRQRETLWKKVIKPIVPADMECSRRSCCTSALKKIILNGDDSFDGIVAPPTLKDRNGLFNEDAVHTWAKDNWPKVLDVAWKINQQRMTDQMELKAAKKRTVSGLEKPADEKAKT
ncbi:hypothetical protein E0Z10_g2912 [Xylaria hypoxylon]|uniref:Uncharacterized protein n=1 Tax=Xylaria hypoxylon TaxID=37992 RepID=A0A4Z0YNF0_9PEZI|nr:hypothetical protein E0Z10_g2912 [Xylaria hypoxylon]